MIPEDDDDLGDYGDMIIRKIAAQRRRITQRMMSF